MKTKLCPRCNTVKSFSNFVRDSRTKTGLKSSCRECSNFMTSRWRKNNPGKHREVAYKSRLRIHYNLTPEGYEQMVRDQNGVCAICREPSTEGKRLAVDHDHNTGKIRGLLCGSCNNGLGRFKDSLERLRNAFDYLESNRSRVQ